MHGLGQFFFPDVVLGAHPSPIRGVHRRVFLSLQREDRPVELRALFPFFHYSAGVLLQQVGQRSRWRRYGGLLCGQGLRRGQ